MTDPNSLLPEWHGTLALYRAQDTEENHHLALMVELETEDQEIVRPYALLTLEQAEQVAHDLLSEVKRFRSVH